MARWTRMLLAVGLAGCSTVAPSPPTRDQVADATYAGVPGAPVTLRDGTWSGPPIAPGAPMHPEVTLVRDFMLTGPVGAGNGEAAVVLLAYTTGGSGEDMYVAVVEGDGRNVGTALLGHNVRVRDGRIVGGQIALDVLQPGPNDAMCCPGELATRTFALSSSGLREVASTVTGRVAMASINGSAWVLARFASGEAAPEKPPVTLVVQDGGISGSAGCNQYGATLTESALPGEIRVGPIRATRMACDAMAVETRYLAALERVTKYALESDDLVLTTSDGGRLVFTPAPAGSRAAPR